MAGRPTKYSQEKADAICRSLKIGCTRTAAAEANGVSYDSFRRWLANYAEFCVAVTRAEAEAESLYTSVIAKAARGTDKEPGDWRAAESWLKRRRRAEWGDNVTLAADREAQRLLSELFPGDAGEDTATPPLGIEP